MARSAGRSAALVAAGIFLSRIAGLVRQRVFSHYLGLGDAADALTAAFRIPNLLQNLLGEGSLSASFIPVYARLRAEGQEVDAHRVAGAVGGLLAAVVALAAAAGVLAAPLLVQLLVPGFAGAKRELTVTLVRVLFPATGVLVLSAWCLGILNSHGRFFLSYAAPVVWNVAMIAIAIVVGAGRGTGRLAVAIAWAAVVGSVLQLLVQLPVVLAVARGLRLSFTARLVGVRTVLTNFGPAVMGRGVNQVSAYVDEFIASWLGSGAVAGLSTAQLLYMMPVSLFGMAVSAAELPAMSAVQGDEQARRAALLARLESGQTRVAYFVIPSAVAFLALGHVITAGVFQTGRFTGGDARYVWAILAGSAVGLVAATLSRLTASAFFAMGDTRTPLRTAAIRVAVAGSVGWLVAIPLPPALGLAPRWGAVGLAPTSGLAAWLEYVLLRRRLTQRLGTPRFPAGRLGGPLLASAAAAGAGWGIVMLTRGLAPLAVLALVVAGFGAVYGGLTLGLGDPTARSLLARGRRG